MTHASKLALALLTCSMASWGTPALAASHREAPLSALDPAADNTDVYAFVSYDKANLLRAPADNFLAGAPGVVGVDITKNGIAKNFPFLPTPYDGKNFRQVNCGETGPGGNPCGPLVP